MATVIEKPSEITQIPIAPGIKLENLIQFDGDCIDPLALVIITESLDYALETSVRRLRSAGKIFSGVEETAYQGGKGVLPVIRAIREALLMAPQCTPEGPRVIPPTSPEEAIVAKIKERTKLTADDIIAALPKEVREKARKEYEKLKEEAKEPKKVSEPSERTLPGLWGPAVFEGKEYESPQVLAKELGIITRGAKNMVVAFKRAGFEVRGDGEKATKGKTGFIVRRVKPTPEKYKAKETIEEFAGPKGTVPTGPIPKPKEEPPEKAREEWIEVRRATTGELLAWEPIDPKTGLAIVERRIQAKPGQESPKAIGFRIEE